MSELEQQRDDHLEFLERSLSGYAESENEAKRMSVSLRVLFHQTNQSHSIVDQMGTKALLEFPQCQAPRGAFAYWSIGDGVRAEVSERAFAEMAYQGLVAKQVSSDQSTISLEFTPLYVNPQFDLTHHPKVGFDAWWGAEVCDHGDGDTFSRKDLVLATANKFGGAHVDPHPSSKALSLKNRSILNLQANGKIVESQTVPLYAAVAQITFEALHAFCSLGQAPVGEA